MKTQNKPSEIQSTRNKRLAVHPNWSLFGGGPSEHHLTMFRTRADVEALFTGRLVFEDCSKALLIEDVIQILKGPPNNPEVGETLIDMMDSGNYLAMAGNNDEFFLKLFGWEAHVSERVMQVYRAGRSDKMANPQLVLNEKTFKGAPHVLRCSPAAKSPQHKVAACAVAEVVSRRQGQNAPVQNNLQAKVGNPNPMLNLTSDEAVKLLRSFSGKRETFSVFDAEAVWRWAEGVRLQHDLLERALAGHVTLWISDKGILQAENPQ